MKHLALSSFHLHARHGWGFPTQKVGAMDGGGGAHHDFLNALALFAVTVALACIFWVHPFLTFLLALIAVALVASACALRGNGGRSNKI